MIAVEDITKYYNDFPAVTGITFNVDQGEILGFLGPNGAGKSTTMKMLTGFMPPTSGSIEIAGYDIVEESLNARRHIGYLPETVPLYQDMTVNDYLYFMGTIRGMNSEQLNRRSGEVVEVCRLSEYNFKRKNHLNIQPDLCKCKFNKFNLGFRLILQAQKLIKWKIIEMPPPVHMAEPSTRTKLDLLKSV